MVALSEIQHPPFAAVHRVLAMVGYSINCLRFGDSGSHVQILIPTESLTALQQVFDCYLLIRIFSFLQRPSRLHRLIQSLEAC